MPPDVAGLMAWTDLAVSAAGSTTWELLHIGVPLVLVTLADNQRAIATSLGHAGLALDLGWHADVTAESIAAAIMALAADGPRRRRMAEQGRLLVDGLGAGRVAVEIEALVSCAGVGR
jgi:spore coat polysaccharide biosynthesis predicted glycosyltransferase SpsG